MTEPKINGVSLIREIWVFEAFAFEKMANFIHFRIRGRYHTREPILLVMESSSGRRFKMLLDLLQQSLTIREEGVVLILAP